MEATWGVAFGAGMLAVVNPCALGMIPAYIALGGPTRLDAASLLRWVVGLVLGFVGLFSLVALLSALFGRALLVGAPVLGAAVGVLLLALGVATLLGRGLHVALPAAPLRGGPEAFASQLLFGATYALASLGCALPVFLAFSAIALADPAPFALVSTIAAFALGTATILLAIVLLAGMSRSVARRLPAQAVSRYAGGALLAGAGVYLLYLQLGFLIGYPLGVPAVVLSL